MSNDARAAAIAKLEAELQRRTEEKLASGELIKIDPIISAWCHADVEAKNASFRAAAEKEYGSKLYWDPLFVITGVPRHDDVEYEDYDQGLAINHEDAIVREDRLPAKPSLEEPAEPKEPIYVAPDQASTAVLVVVSNGNDQGDPGQVEHGCFSVAGGVLSLESPSGKFVGSRRLREGDDPAAVARSLLRDSIDTGTAFTTRTLNYPRGSVA